MKKLAILFALVLTLACCLSSLALAQGNGFSLGVVPIGNTPQPQGVLTFKKDSSFYGGQKLDIYTGPGYEYLRIGNAKASTDEEIKVAGIVDGWILIQYPTKNGSVRVGYFNRDDLKYTFKTNSLSLMSQPATVTKACQVCDDPVLGNQAFATIPAGTNVYYLASYDDHYSWAYIEFVVIDQQTNARKMARGFVPADCVSY